MEKKKKRVWIWGAAILAVIVLAAGVWFGVASYVVHEAKTPKKPGYDPGTWIELRPEGIVSADGQPVYSEMRIGDENKVMILFYGGGVSVNAFTASHPFTGALFTSDENGFYTENIEGMIPDYCELGIASTRADKSSLNFSRFCAIL